MLPGQSSTGVAVALAEELVEELEEDSDVLELLEDSDVLELDVSLVVLLEVVTSSTGGGGACTRFSANLVSAATVSPLGVAAVLKKHFPM